MIPNYYKYFYDKTSTEICLFINKLIMSFFSSVWIYALSAISAWLYNHLKYKPNMGSLGNFTLSLF